MTLWPHLPVRFQDPDLALANALCDSVDDLDGNADRNSKTNTNYDCRRAAISDDIMQTQIRYANNPEFRSCTWVQKQDLRLSLCVSRPVGCTQSSAQVFSNFNIISLRIKNYELHSFIGEVCQILPVLAVLPITSSSASPDQMPSRQWPS